MKTPDLIVVHNHKGGTGKTMIASHLGFYLRGLGIAWTVFDMDSQHNSISWLTGHEWTGESNLTLPATSRLAEMHLTTRFPNLDKTPHLLVDTPPADGVLKSLTRKIALNERDILLCPTDGRFSIDGAIKVAEEVASTGCRVVFVVNKTETQDGYAQEEIRAVKELCNVPELNTEVFNLAIPTNVRFMREAELRGVPVWDLDYAGRTHIAKALRAFCHWIATGASPHANADPNESGGEAHGITERVRKRLWTS